MDGWGQTETGPLTFRLHTRRSVVRGRTSTHSVGHAVPVKTRLRLVDPTTMRPVSPGRPGIVLARTAARCLDYLGESERWSRKNVESWWNTGYSWWNTGDIAIRNRDGSLRLLDREVDSTPDTSCIETEGVLEDRLPEACECVLLAPSGKPPLPVVVTTDGTLTERSWQRASSGLPTMQQPTVLTWEEVPRTGTAKVRRRALLEQLTGSTATCGTGNWT